MRHCLRLQKWLHLNSELDIQCWKRQQKIDVQILTIATAPMPHPTLISCSSRKYYSNSWHCFAGTVQKLYLDPYKPRAEWYSSTIEKSELTTEKNNISSLWTSLDKKIFKSHRWEYAMWTNKCCSYWAGFQSTLFCLLYLVKLDYMKQKCK